MLLLLIGCSEYGLGGRKDEPQLGEPDIVVTPETLTFDATAVDCPQELPVTIENVGEATLEVSDVLVEGDAPFTVSGGVGELVPGASTVALVRYEAAREGLAEAELVVDSDDPDEDEVRVGLSGMADDEVTVDDTWEQDAPPVDVLWVIDNSSSMGQEQARVIAEISAFFTWFETLGLDYHMGVVTSDVVTPTMQGRLQGSPAYIEPTTPDAEAELAEALNVGTDDQGDESGLHAAELALSEPVVSAENAGFLRTDANLVVIFLSDEPEQSAYDAQHYVDFFGAVKADPGDVGIHAIVGDREVGCANVCDGTDQTATAGDKYIDVVDAFGGVFGSICECDLSPALDEIGLESTLFIRTFPLSQVPSDPARIVVRVDGEGTAAWTWDGNANAIVFDTPPLGGQLVEASYPVPATCAESG
ncbi:MAG: hypothetical protein ACOZNI_23905 [Myxococcota bacterium]